MEAKAIQATRSKLNELAASHNKLTTLVAILLTEVQTLKEEMNQVKQMLDGVEVVEERATAPPAPPAAAQQQRMMSSAPTQPVKSASSSSSSRSRNNRNSSLAELHADDIIKQLTLNAD